MHGSIVQAVILGVCAYNKGQPQASDSRELQIIAKFCSEIENAILDPCHLVCKSTASQPPKTRNHVHRLAWSLVLSQVHLQSNDNTDAGFAHRHEISSRSDWLSHACLIAELQEFRLRNAGTVDRENQISPCISKLELHNDLAVLLTYRNGTCTR